VAYQLITQEEALDIAQMSWGPTAFANNSLVAGTVSVGVVTNADWDVRGRGATFEEAFKEADSAR